MPVTAVSSSWNESGYEGDLAFLDASGNIIFVIESTSREIVIPSGSNINGLYQYIGCHGAFDNQTIKLGPVAQDCVVTRCTYFTDNALGSGAGIDVLDGGAAGSGSTVINASAANLSGVDSNVVASYALSAGDYINVKFDDFTYETHCSVTITLKTA